MSASVTLTKKFEIRNVKDNFKKYLKEFKIRVLKYLSKSKMRVHSKHLFSKDI